MIELLVLRTIALKGRVPLEDVVATTGAERDDVLAQVSLSTTADHLLVAPNGALRTTPAGRERLERLLGDERAGIDLTGMRALYEEFCEVNTVAKETFTAWQMRADGEPNDHADTVYDEQVLDRLSGVNLQVLPIVERAARHVPRASRYRERLIEAQRRYAAGDHSYVTRPLIDSYHTVWFEMHEDLISWAGLTRADEAAAGRAT